MLKKCPNSFLPDFFFFLPIGQDIRKQVDKITQASKANALAMEKDSQYAQTSGM